MLKKELKRNTHISYGELGQYGIQYVVTLPTTGEKALYFVTLSI